MFRLERDLFAQTRNDRSPASSPARACWRVGECYGPKHMFLLGPDRRGGARRYKGVRIAGKRWHTAKGVGPQLRCGWRRQRRPAAPSIEEARDGVLGECATTGYADQCRVENNGGARGHLHLGAPCCGPEVSGGVLCERTTSPPPGTPSLARGTPVPCPPPAAPVGAAPLCACPQRACALDPARSARATGLRPLWPPALSQSGWPGTASLASHEEANFRLLNAFHPLRGLWARHD